MKTKYLRLTLDVAFNAANVNTPVLRGHLEQVVKDAVNNGTLTGDTPATVETYSFKITEMKPKKKSVPSRKTGEHLWHEHDGITKCVTCFCDEDDAHVGGEKCSFVAPKKPKSKKKKSNVIHAYQYKGRNCYVCEDAEGLFFVSIADEDGKHIDSTPARNDIESVKEAAANIIDQK
jgi:hypothetical protein